MTEGTNMGQTEATERSSRRGEGSAERASPFTIEKYLKGLNYPASKEDLIAQAQENNAPENVIDVLNRFEDKDYRSPADVAKEASSLE